MAKSNYVRTTVSLENFQGFLNIMTHCHVTAVQTGGSTTAVAREQLCGHVVFPGTGEHAIMEKSFYLRFVLGYMTRTTSSVGFGNPEEGERPPLEVTTKQRLVKTEKTLCVP
jgi:hypothetical protein